MSLQDHQPATAAPGVEAAARPLAGRSIVVVSTYYAPDPTGIAPYATDFCHTLRDGGAAVTALVGIPHYPAWRCGDGYRYHLTSDEWLDGVRLLRGRHYVPRRQDAVRRAAYEATFAASALWAARRLGPHHDAVIAVIPNLGCLPLAGLLARRLGSRLGVIVQDLTGRAAGQSGVPGARRLAGAAGWLEGRWLARADRVAVVADAFRSDLIARGTDPARIVRLPNHTLVEPSRIDRTEARRRLGWPQDRYLVVHTGNMGFKQDLGSVVAASRLAGGRPDAPRFLLVGDGSAREQLAAQAADVPALELVPPLPAEQYPLALAAADCLLLNERPTVLNMSLPSKLTAYLVAGRPVLAAVAENGATAKELQRSGGGIRVDPGNPAALLAGIEGLRRDPQGAARCSEQGAAYAQQYLDPRAARTRALDFVQDLLGGADRQSRTG